MAVPVMLLAALASSAYQMYQGKKTQDSAKEEAAKAPKSVIPESAKLALAHGSNLAKGRMAGAQQAEQSLDEAEATASYRAEKGSTSTQQYQGLVSAAQGMKQRGTRQIAGAEAQDKTQRENVYINQLSQMAGMEQQVKDANDTNAWNIEQGVRAAGRQQVSSGLQSAVAAGMMSMNADGGGVQNRVDSEIAPEMITPKDTSVAIDGMTKIQPLQSDIQTATPNILPQANPSSLSQTIGDVPEVNDLDRIAYENYKSKTPNTVDQLSYEQFISKGLTPIWKNK